MTNLLLVSNQTSLSSISTTNSKPASLKTSSQSYQISISGPRNTLQTLFLLAVMLGRVVNLETVTGWQTNSNNWLILKRSLECLLTAKQVLAWYLTINKLTTQSESQTSSTLHFTFTNSNQGQLLKLTTPILMTRSSISGMRQQQTISIDWELISSVKWWVTFPRTLVKLFKVNQVLSFRIHKESMMINTWISTHRCSKRKSWETNTLEFQVNNLQQHMTTMYLILELMAIRVQIPLEATILTV